MQAVRYTRPLLDVSDYIVLDIETTGVNAKYDVPVEIGLLRVVNNEIVERFETLVNPGRHIPAAASAVNYIFDEDVSDAPTFQSIAPVLHEWLKGKIVVAHNAYFDTQIISRLMTDCGYSGQFKYVDTLFYSRKVFHGVENYKLQTLATQLNLGVDQAHRALGDAITCHELFQLCKSQPQEPGLAQKTVQEEYDSYSPPVNTPMQPTASNVQKTVQSNNAALGRPKPHNKWVAFLLCLFLGMFGAHKFYDGKIGSGILYLFTAGLFLVGWIIDIFKILNRPNPYYIT